MTTIDELAWFVTLAETEHMTRAADQLNVAQPTLSRALRRLEREVGAPLFDRVNRRLRLNRSGEILLEHARRGLAELTAAQDRITTWRDPERGTIRLAFLHSIATWLTPDVLRAHRARAPEATVELTQAVAHEILEHLRAARVDVALTTPPPPDDDELAWVALHREQLCLAVPADRPLAQRERIDLAEAATETFVVLREPIGFRRLTDELCARAGIAPRVAFESTEIGTLEGLVAAELGVAIVPTPRPDRAEPGVAYLPLADEAAHRVIGLVWPRHACTPAVTAFIDVVTRDFGAAGPPGP